MPSNHNTRPRKNPVAAIAPVVPPNTNQAATPVAIPPPAVVQPPGNALNPVQPGPQDNQGNGQLPQVPGIPIPVQPPGPQAAGNGPQLNANVIQPAGQPNNVAIQPFPVLPNLVPNNPLGHIPGNQPAALEIEVFMDYPDQELTNANSFFPALDTAVIASKAISASPQTHRLTITPSSAYAENQIIVLPRLANPTSFDSIIPALETLVRITQCDANALIFTGTIIHRGFRIVDDNFPQILPDAIPQQAVFLKTDFPYLLTLSPHAISIMNPAKKAIIFQGYVPVHYLQGPATPSPSAAAILSATIAPELPVPKHANKNIEELSKGGKTAATTNSQILNFTIFDSLCNNNHDHTNALVDNNTDIMNDAVTMILLRQKNKMSLMGELAVHFIPGALSQICIANCTESGTWSKSKVLSFCLAFFAPFWTYNRENCLETFRDCAMLISALQNLCKFYILLFDLESIKDEEPDLYYLWSHLFDVTISLLQNRLDFNIGLLSPKQRNAIILNIVVEVFAILRKPANHQLSPMDKLKACRVPQLKYDGEKQHAMATYFNKNAITPEISIINLEGKIVGHVENVEPYKNQEVVKKPLSAPLEPKVVNNNNNNNNNNKYGNGDRNRGRNNDFRDDRDRERFIRDRGKQHNDRDRERSRDRNKENDSRHYQRDNRDPIRDNRSGKQEVCLDQLAYTLEIPGRKPCQYGKSCKRDHNFKKPLRKETKDKVLYLLDNEKYSGKHAPDILKKFKADALRAMGM